MKVIVFHSYKGGVGRTLTVANLGVALSRLGKRVVMLDLDVDAPGLHLKFPDRHGTPRTISQGYIDYLNTYFRPTSSTVTDKIRTILHRSGGSDAEQRVNALRALAIDVELNLKLIPAGSCSIEYWWKLALPWFQELFSLSGKEFSLKTGIALHKHRDFLLGELDIFKQVFHETTDYLLVDCRSSREYSSVPLYYWADVVVSMFPSNLEGLQGAVHICQAVLKARKPERRPRFYPVVCRVPESFSEAEAEIKRQEFLSYWKSVDPKQQLEVPTQPFCILHEYRLLETAERILLQAASGPGKAAVEVDVSLAHDYVHLFRLILEGDAGVASALPRADEKAWKAALGLAADVQILESYFRRLADGQLLNVDNKRNVAVRTATLLSLMNSLQELEGENLKALGYDAAAVGNWILKSFHQAGYVIGSDFGQEAMEEGRVWETIPTELGDRIAGWCRFDQQAGFGSLHYQFDAATRSGDINWTQSFLLQEGTLQPHVKEFARGYVHGVLSNLLEMDVKVCMKSDEVLCFRPKGPIP